MRLPGREGQESPREREHPGRNRPRVPALTRLEALRAIVAAPLSCPDDRRIGHRYTFRREQSRLRVQISADVWRFNDGVEQVMATIRRIA